MLLKVLFGVLRDTLLPGILQQLEVKLLLVFRDLCYLFEPLVTTVNKPPAKL